MNSLIIKINISSPTNAYQDFACCWLCNTVLKSEVILTIIAIELEDSYSSPETPMESSNTYKSPKATDSYNGIYKTPAQKSYTYGSLKPIMNPKDSYGNPVNSLDNMYVIYKKPLNPPGQGYRNRHNLIERSSSS